MVRNRQRKTDIGTFTEDQMRQALLHVENGHSIRKSAAMTGIKKSTLWSYVKKAKSKDDQIMRFRPNYECRRVFSAEEEDTIVGYVITCSEMNFVLSRRDMRKLAYEVAKKYNKAVPPNWHKCEMAGIDWLLGFLKRHDQFLVRKPQPCSLSIETSFNRHNVYAFFDKLEEIYSTCPPFANGTRVYNLDETAMTTVQASKFEKSSKRVVDISSAERGTTVTTCCMINSLGQALPPAIVFPSVHFEETMLFGAPTGTLGLANPSGQMSSDLFLDVMKHFAKFSNASKENPALLILDNHESHLSIPVIDFAKQNGVTMLTLHPHCSHKMQPLDVSVHAPFKKYYSQAMRARHQQNPGVPITIYEVAALVGEAYEKAMVSANIICGFKKTGIFPYNRDVFYDYEFFPSPIIDEPFHRNNTDLNASTSSAGTEALIDMPNKHLSNTVTEHQVSEVSKTPVASSEESVHNHKSICSNKNDFSSPQQLYGYSKAGQRKKENSNRQKVTSMILTDTPQKNLSSQGSKAKSEITKSRKLQFNRSPEIHHHLPDTLLDDGSEDDEWVAQFPSFAQQPSVNDYVLVEFEFL